MSTIEVGTSILALNTTPFSMKPYTRRIIKDNKSAKILRDDTGIRGLE